MEDRLANVNKNKNQAWTGGPSIASTGAEAQSEQPDSQKGSAANATGEKDYVEKDAPDAKQKGGKQPNDAVQHN